MKRAVTIPHVFGKSEDATIVIDKNSLRIKDKSDNLTREDEIEMFYALRRWKY